MQQRVFTLGSVVIGTLYALSNPLQAASVPYSFEVMIDSGPRTGNQYQGSFTYDDTALIGSGEEYLALTQFTFGFDSSNVTLADDPLAEASFYDGSLLGISFNVSSPAYALSFVPGFFDLNEAFFAYDLSTEGGGFGNLNIFTVPLPASLPLLLTALTTGAFGWRRKPSHQQGA